MSKEIIDVIDTAVKIGLGASITGLATYLISKLNNKKDKEKFILEHKIKTIEVASDKLETYFNSISSLYSSIGGKIRGKSISNIYELSDSDKKIILDRDKELQSAWFDRNYAVSRFHLLKAKEVIKAIEEIEKFETDLRNIFILNSQIISTDELKKKSQEYNNLKKIFYEKASAYYSTLSI
ncbi:MAG: hypothetical protein WDA23_10435 [Gemmobacter sp.]